MQTTLELFNESVGYETYFIINSLKELGRTGGISEDFGISFVSHSYKTRTINLADNIAEDGIREYIEKNMLPLIFTSSFKILDMFMEHLIHINGSNSPWQFKKKIEYLKTHLISMKFPDEFELKMVQCIFNLYKNLVKYRNMLIHGVWGEVRNGKMVFKDEAKIFELSKEHILALSNIAHMIIKILNDDQDSIYMSGYKSTLERELNCFADMFAEKFDLFPEMFVIYHEIHYLLEDDDEEKLVVSAIRQKIEQLQKDLDNKFSIVFDVVVEKQTGMWKIPSNKLPLSCDEVQLSEFLNYKIN